MASKLPIAPSSVSRLRPPSSLPTFSRTAPVANKRIATGSSNQEPPAKKTRENVSTMGPPQTRRVITQQKIRRSVSMASISVGPNIKNKTRELSGTLTTSTTNVSGIGGARKPVANITSKVNNRATVTSASGLRRNNSVNRVDTSQSSNTSDKGVPSKRKPWDLKGQIQDKNHVIQEMKQERDNIFEKFEMFEQRLNELETEKQSLGNHLTETESVKAATKQELEEINKKYSDLQESHATTIRELKDVREDLERKERRCKEYQMELDVKVEELVQLKKTLLEMSSSRSVLEAERDTYKLSSESLQSQLTQAVALNLELKDKVATGETFRRKLHNQVLELKGNIRVFCRVRPLLGQEVSNNGGSEDIAHINVLTENSLELLKDGNTCDTSSMSGLKSRSNGALEFAYDRVFGPKDSQSDVFEEVSQLVQSALDGYNVCVFAYGQTGSGKTFTMEGVPHCAEKAGIIPRTINFLYDHINVLTESAWEFTIEASFLEIYNESIRDLLVSQSEAKSLSYDIKTTDAKTPHTHVSNLKVVSIKSAEDIYTLLSTAHKNRAVAATNMNLQSSRSHSVFRMVLHGHNHKTGEVVQGSLNLVDLAGSERLKESGSTGARLTETQNINKSLSNLSSVIMALGQKQPHIPYRNSKLTHLLQPSLGGNSKTLMLVNVSPLEMCTNETLNSLRFAAKVNSCHIGTATKHAKKV